ncbi:MAG: HAMP domain-containing sensor histidine kinase [Pseudomonadota bacterium]
MEFRNNSVDKNIVNVAKQRSASSKAVRDFRTKINSAGTTPIAYERELLIGYCRNQIYAGLATPVLVAIAGTLAAQLVDPIIAFIWSIATILTHVFLGVLSKKFLSQVEQDDTLNLTGWRVRFLLGNGLIALCWSMFAVLSCSNCTGNEFAIVQFSTLLVFVAASSMSNHALGYIALVSVLPPALILAGKFVWMLEPVAIMMGGILLIAIAFFHVLGKRFQQMIVSMLEHTTEKEALIVELETEKSFSEDARNRAEEANLAKSRFLATMSHELRTPLNAVLGFSEIMRDEVLGPINNEVYRDYAKDIHSSGSHLLKLINEILDLSRIEAGKHELNEEPLNLTKVVDDAKHMIEIKARKKEIRLSTSYQEKLPKVWADERAIRQVTLNLLSNAVKFTPTGGEITLKIGWTAKGGQYISIKDSGPGIPQEEIPLVLSSFGQGTIAIKHAEPGTGLGLSIVQALLHMHQGRFDLKSKLREGTEAIAYLPVERVDTRSIAPSMTTPEMETDNQPNVAARTNPAETGS